MKLIVFETRGEWAAALRRRLTVDLVPIQETRSIAECEAELASAPASFVVAELNRANASALLTQLAAWQRRMPGCVLSVVADRMFVPWRSIVCEAGAALATFSPRKLDDLIAALKRHWQRCPQPPGTAAERIWAELPLG